MDALGELTDREKETLRLIVRGHDAKSMASELSLSVHTINERLREARRKLGVTSSREAARLLLEREGADPQKLADKDLGEARQDKLSEGDSATTVQPARRIFAGVSLMITLFAAGLILTSHFGGTELGGVPAEVSATDEVVVGAARNWLELVDAGNWQASFDAAGKAFRDVNTVTSWSNVAKQVSAPLGKVISRELLTVRYLNAPPHGYQEVTFATHYTNKADPVIETVTLEQDGDVWKVVGILVD